MLAVSLAAGIESAREMTFRRCSIPFVSKHALCSVPVILDTTLNLRCRDNPSFVNSLSSATGVCNCLGFDVPYVQTVSISDPLICN